MKKKRKNIQRSQCRKNGCGQYAQEICLRKTLRKKIENGEAEIIVGTQMISKGLDFDNIELVAIPKADSLLYVQDFRAEERAYQLITQVSGRAGRISGNGKIYIQTYNPFHPLFELIKEENSAKIYEHFLKEREQFLYPPFCKINFN